MKQTNKDNETAKHANNLKEQPDDKVDPAMIQPSPVRDADRSSPVRDADRSPSVRDADQSPSDLDADKGSNRIPNHQYKFLGRLPYDNSDRWRIDPSAIDDRAKGVRRRKREVLSNSLETSVLSESIDISSIPDVSSITPSSSFVVPTSVMSSFQSSTYYSYNDYDYDSWVSWYRNGYSSSYYYDYYNYYDGGGNSWNSWNDGNMYIYSQLSSKKDQWDERVQDFRTLFKDVSM